MPTKKLLKKLLLTPLLNNWTIQLPLLRPTKWCLKIISKKWNNVFLKNNWSWMPQLKRLAETLSFWNLLRKCAKLSEMNLIVLLKLEMKSLNSLILSGKWWRKDLEDWMTPVLAEEMIILTSMRKRHMQQIHFINDFIKFDWNTSLSH